MTQTQQPRPAVAQALDVSETPLLDAAMDQTAKKLDALERQYKKESEVDGLSSLRRALLAGAAISRMETLLTDEVMKFFMRLMNTGLGFKTDRGPHAKEKEMQEPYPVAVVRRVLAEALLKGFMPFNDEFQILASNFFGGQRGWKRKFWELPGVTDIEMIPGTPRPSTPGSPQICCRVACRWKLNGVSQELRGPDGSVGRDFPIQTNSKSNADNTIGKALRKGYMAAWEQVTGQKLEPDEEPQEMLGTVPDVPAPGKHNLRPANGNGKKEHVTGSPAPGEVKQEEAEPSKEQLASYEAAGKAAEQASLQRQGPQDVDAPNEPDEPPSQMPMEVRVARFKEAIQLCKTAEAVQDLYDEADQMAERKELSRSTAIELQGLCTGMSMKLKQKGAKK